MRQPIIGQDAAKTMNPVNDRPGPAKEDSARNAARTDGFVPAGTALRKQAAEFRLEKRREVRYLLAIICAIFFSWLVRFMPTRFRYWLADRCGSLSFRLSTTYRENVRANISQALGEPPESPQVTETAKAIFRTNARNFADLLVIPHVAPSRFVSAVPLISGSWSYLDEAVAAGHGVVIMTAHLGPFDYLGQSLHVRGIRPTSVTGRTTARFLFDAVTFLRRSRGMKIVEASPSGIRRVIQGLRRGECAVFVTDRDFFQNGKPVTLFGRETTLPPGPVRIARDTGAPIIPIFARRLSQSYGISIVPAFHVEKTDDIETDIRRGMEQMALHLERAIGASLDQWVMFQRVWPSEPVDPVRVFPIGSPLAGEFLERVDAALPGGRSARPSSSANHPAEPPTDHMAAPPQSERSPDPQSAGRQG
jgi:KDO2-lipid IV(A) lauroyltransferase